MVAQTKSDGGDQRWADSKYILMVEQTGLDMMPEYTQNITDNDEIFGLGNWVSFTEMGNISAGTNWR